MPAPAVTILHADMDAFYAAVEQLDDPALRGKAVVVGGSSPRGVVLTASYEARRFGVHSAMPGHHARNLCPECLFVRPRMSRYAEVAGQIRRVFEAFTPLVEPLSLDEAFLDITDSLGLFGGAERLGYELKHRVHRETGLTVSVGIAPTKMVAKIASDICKPDGLLRIDAGHVEAFLRPLPVGRLWGIGPSMQRKLAALGIETIGELADAADLRRRLGRSAEFWQALARGDDRRIVVAGRSRKSYGEERTFEHDLKDGDEVRRVLAEHAEAVARRLRRDRRAARTVTLKMKLAQRTAPGKYPVLTRSVTFAMPVDDGKRLAEAIIELWASSHSGRSVRLLGVSASGIDDIDTDQLMLFDSGERRREKALNRAVDLLTARFGSGVVKRGAPRR
jgi:DNA polymerase-4